MPVLPPRGSMTLGRTREGRREGGSALCSVSAGPEKSTPKDALTDKAKQPSENAPRETVPARATVSSVLILSCPVRCRGGRPPHRRVPGDSEPVAGLWLTSAFNASISTTDFAFLVQRATTSAKPFRIRTSRWMHFYSSLTMVWFFGFFFKKPSLNTTLAAGVQAGRLCMAAGPRVICDFAQLSRTIISYHVRLPPRPSRWAAAEGERAAAAGDSTTEEAILQPLREKESEVGRRSWPGGTRPPRQVSAGAPGGGEGGPPAGATRYSRLRAGLAGRQGSAGEGEAAQQALLLGGALRPLAPRRAGRQGWAERGRQEALFRRARRAGQGMPQRVNERAAAPGCPCRETGEKEQTGRGGLENKTRQAAGAAERSCLSFPPARPGGQRGTRRPARSGGTTMQQAEKAGGAAYGNMEGGAERASP